MAKKVIFRKIAKKTQQMNLPSDFIFVYDRMIYD
jgi:hypothetical protein